MSSPANWLIKGIIKLNSLLYRKREPEVVRLRQDIERWCHLIPVPRGTVITPDSISRCYGEWIQFKAASGEKVVYYLHGGGYAIGTVKAYRRLLTILSRLTGIPCFGIDYRLAPEHPYPAALMDAVEGYRKLLSMGYQPENIAIAGDSAGGGLTVATALKLRDEGLPLPACLVCISPWTNLEGPELAAYPWLKANGLLTIGRIRQWAMMYAPSHDLRNPLISPAFADLSGMPPLLIHVSREELLLDDAIKLFHRAMDSGIHVTIEFWEGMIHDWHLWDIILPEAKHALISIAHFLRKKLKNN